MNQNISTKQNIESGFLDRKDINKLKTENIKKGSHILIKVGGFDLGMKVIGSSTIKNF